MARNYQKRNAKEYNILRGAFQWLTCSVFAIYYRFGLNLKVEGRENVPKHTFFIVASNHVSANDPFIIIHAIKKRVAYMAKIELFQNAIRSFFLNALGAFAVDRSKLSPSTVKTVLGLKETGWAFGIFPQGKREKEGELGLVNKGFAIFAKILKCEILPVAIMGADKEQRKFLRGKLKVKIGKPIPYNDNVEEMIELWSKSIAELMNESKEEKKDEEKKPDKVNKINYALRKAKDFNIFTRLYQYYALYVLFLPTFGLFLYDFKVKRNKNLEKKPYIVAPNHVSYLDVFALNYLMRRPLAYMAKQELFRNGNWGESWVTRNIVRLGGFAVNREKPTLSTIKTVKEVLKAKYDLCIFPQGGIRKNKKIENINAGFIYFAKTNKVDILPVGISCLEKYNWNPFKRQKANLSMGTPISYELPEEEILSQWKKQVCDLTGYENADAKN